MENTNPLQYFEDLLASNKLSLLEEQFINDFMEHGNTMRVESIDKEQGIIEYWDFFYDEIKDDRVEGITSVNFSRSFNQSVYKEFSNSKKIIDDTAAAITVNGNNPIEYITLQSRTLNYLERKAIEVYPNTPNLVCCWLSILIKSNCHCNLG